MREAARSKYKRCIEVGRSDELFASMRKAMLSMAGDTRTRGFASKRLFGSSVRGLASKTLEVDASNGFTPESSS